MLPSSYPACSGDATTECNLSFEDETTNGRRTYTVDGSSWVVDRAGPTAEWNIKYKRIIMPDKWYDGHKPMDNDNVRPKNETMCLVVCGGISIRRGGDYESSP
jgi:hypothetical protein